MSPVEKAQSPQSHKSIEDSLDSSGKKETSPATTRATSGNSPNARKEPASCMSRDPPRGAERDMLRLSSPSALDFSTSATSAAPAFLSPGPATAGTAHAPNILSSSDGKETSGTEQASRVKPTETITSEEERRNSSLSEHTQNRKPWQKSIPESPGVSANLSEQRPEVNPSASEKVLDSVAQSEASPLDLCVKKSGKLNKFLFQRRL